MLHRRWLAIVAAGFLANSSCSLLFETSSSTTEQEGELDAAAPPTGARPLDDGGVSCPSERLEIDVALSSLSGAHLLDFDCDGLDEVLLSYANDDGSEVFISKGGCLLTSEWKFQEHWTPRIDIGLSEPTSSLPEDLDMSLGGTSDSCDSNEQLMVVGTSASNVHLAYFDITEIVPTQEATESFFMPKVEQGVGPCLPAMAPFFLQAGAYDSEISSSEDTQHNDVVLWTEALWSYTT